MGGGSTCSGHRLFVLGTQVVACRRGALGHAHAAGRRPACLVGVSRLSGSPPHFTIARFSLYLLPGLNCSLCTRRAAEHLADGLRCKAAPISCPGLLVPRTAERPTTCCRSRALAPAPHLSSSISARQFSSRGRLQFAARRSNPEVKLKGFNNLLGLPVGFEAPLPNPLPTQDPHSLGAAVFTWRVLRRELPRFMPRSCPLPAYRCAPCHAACG